MLQRLLSSNEVLARAVGAIIKIEHKEVVRQQAEQPAAHGLVRGFGVQLVERRGDERGHAPRERAAERGGAEERAAGLERVHESVGSAGGSPARLRWSSSRGRAAQRSLVQVSW